MSMVQGKLQYEWHLQTHAEAPRAALSGVVARPCFFFPNSLVALEEHWLPRAGADICPADEI